MSTPAYVKRVTGQTGTGPVLYRDQIMDAGFVGHYDFISDYVKNGYVAGTPFASPATVRSLVRNGAPAAPETVWAAPFTGGFTSKGLKLQSGSNAKLKLPDAFKLPANTTRFAFCVWASVETALGAIMASTFESFAGYAYQTGTYCQYVVGFTTDANSAVLSLRFIVNGLNLQVTTPAVLAKITDGAMHQYAMDAEVISGGTQVRITGYMDGVQVGQATVAFSGALNDPSAEANPQKNVVGPYVGQIGGYQPAWGHYGRVWLKRHSLDPSGRSTADIVAQEWAAYKADYV